MNCVVLRVENKPNTAINVDKDKSLIKETRNKNENILLMGFYYHCVHSTTKKMFQVNLSASKAKT